MKKVRGTPNKNDSSSSHSKKHSKTQKRGGSSILMKLFLFFTFSVLGLAVFLSLNYSSLEPTVVERRGKLEENFFLNQQKMAIFTAKHEAKNAKAALVFVHGISSSYLLLFFLSFSKKIFSFFSLFFKNSLIIILTKGFAEHQGRYLGN